MFALSIKNYLLLFFVDTHFEIYENGLITTAFNWKNNTYTSLCYVESVFENVELNNTNIRCL